MNDQATLLSRIGKWFKRDHTTDGESRLVGDAPSSSTSLETRTTFLRPWAKRDAAINQLQEGFTTLTDLMSAIRTNLEQQNQRQNELMGALQQLPQVLQSIPETNRVQSEALSAIRQQIEGQSAQQERLGTILDRIGHNSESTSQVLTSMRDNIDARDGRMERVLHRQGVRFTTMLAVAIFLSIAALVAVGVIGYLLIVKPH